MAVRMRRECAARESFQLSHLLSLFDFVSMILAICTPRLFPDGTLRLWKLATREVPSVASRLGKRIATGADLLQAHTTEKPGLVPRSPCVTSPVVARHAHHPFDRPSPGCQRSSEARVHCLDGPRHCSQLSYKEHGNVSEDGDGVSCSACSLGDRCALAASLIS